MSVILRSKRVNKQFGGSQNGRRRAARVARPRLLTARKGRHCGYGEREGRRKRSRRGGGGGGDGRESAAVTVFHEHRSRLDYSVSRGRRGL